MTLGPVRFAIVEWSRHPNHPNYPDLDAPYSLFASGYRDWWATVATCKTLNTLFPHKFFTPTNDDAPKWP